MRIIAGKYRGRNLKSPPSLQVRPTSDRLRETLFNVIAPRIEDSRFLDLCAGSGAVGIEALSRGARHATFVDRSRKMCGLIEANLDLCKIPEDETHVAQAEAAEFLRHARRRPSPGPRLVSPEPENRLIDCGSGDDKWDIVFFDPPYDTDYLQVLDMFGKQAPSLLIENGLLIVEHHHKNELKDAVGSIIRSRILKQGDSALSFYEAQKQEC
jgi:16S rRNA (guanine966-N2)-methyltransferase